MADQEQEYSVTLRNGALAKLRKVAQDLGVSEDNLGDVLIKGLNLMDAAKDGTTVTIEKKKEKYVIDLRQI